MCLVSPPRPPLLPGQVSPPFEGLVSLTFSVSKGGGDVSVPNDRRNHPPTF